MVIGNAKGVCGFLAHPFVLYNQIRPVIARSAFCDEAIPKLQGDCFAEFTLSPSLRSG